MAPRGERKKPGVFASVEANTQAGGTDRDARSEDAHGAALIAPRGVVSSC